jgi:hypothetical protein
LTEPGFQEMKDEEREDQSFRERHGSRLKELLNRDASRCPSSDRLVDLQEGRLRGRKRREVEDHVHACPFCLKAWEALRREASAGSGAVPDDARWRGIESAMDRKFAEALSGSAVPDAAKPDGAVAPAGPDRPVRASFDRFFSGRPRSRIPAFAGGLAVLILVSVYATAFFGRDPLFGLARVTPEKHALLRSRGTPSPSGDALREYERGRFQRAVSGFETDSRIHPGRYETMYYLGISRLKTAERGLPGLAVRFDRTAAAEGGRDLERALALAGDNAFYRADCLWYLAKAALMRGDTERAARILVELRRTNLPDSPRPGQAERLLSGLGSLSPRR